MTVTTDALSAVHMVPLTPFDSDGEFAEDVHRAHIERLAHAGVRVFLPAAGTSGFYQLEPDEITRIVCATVDVTGSSGLTFAPVGMRPGEALAIGRRARDVGAAGIMFMPAVGPYLSDAGLRDYYTEIMDAVGLPTLIYKKGPLPSNDLLLELADHPLFVGVKYAEPNIEPFHRAVMDDGGRLAWICGLAERYANSFVAQGAVGYTSGAGNLAPRLTLRLHAELMDGDVRAALETQRLLLPIERFRARAGDSFNISMLQCAMRMLDDPLDFGSPRRPMRRVTEAEESEIRDLLAPILSAERALRTAG